MAKVDSTKKKKPPTFQHLPEIQGVSAVVVLVSKTPIHTFDTTFHSQEAEAFMGSSPEDQKSVEGAETEGGVNPRREKARDGS